jgi:hypothetical protein
MEYILFVFAAHEEQEKLVKSIAEEISAVSDLSDVKFYFGPESAIYVFKSSESFDSVKDFFRVMLGLGNVVYFLSELDKDKTDYYLTDEVKKHLFESEDFTYKMTNEEKDEIDNLLLREFNDEKFKLFCEELEDEDDDIMKMKKKTKEPTLNDLLDKISSEGINSLTKKEKELLTKYSK